MNHWNVFKLIALQTLTLLGKYHIIWESFQLKFQLVKLFIVCECVWFDWIVAVCYIENWMCNQLSLSSHSLEINLYFSKMELNHIIKLFKTMKCFRWSENESISTRSCILEYNCTILYFECIRICAKRILSSSINHIPFSYWNELKFSLIFYIFYL